MVFILPLPSSCQMGGMSSSDLAAPLTEIAMGHRLNFLAIIAFSFCRWWPWSSEEHRLTGMATPVVASSPLDLFLVIQPGCTVKRFHSRQLISAA